MANIIIKETNDIKLKEEEIIHIELDRSEEEEEHIELIRVRKERASRLKKLRRLTDKSRREFSEKYNIPAGTLQNWEDARYGGLTEKGSKRIIKAFKIEGIFCTLEWLMHGIGAAPQISERLYLNDKHMISERKVPDHISATPVGIPSQVSHHHMTTQQSFSTLVQELLLFRQINANTTDTVIVDDGMEPRFVVNEQVAGIQRFGDLSSLIGLDCIIQTIHGDVLVRNLRAGNEKGCYNLTCINPNTTVSKPILYDVELYSAAPIIWARREDPIYSSSRRDD